MTSAMSVALAGSTPAAGSSGPPRSLADWANEISSWSSPDGLILHTLQPVMAESLRQSGVSGNTEWGKSLQAVLDDPRAVASFRAGMSEGVLDGAKSLLGGAWDLAKGAAYASYNTSAAGFLVDGAHKLGLIGDVPGWMPDASRVTDKAQAIGEGIGSYMKAVGQDPSKLGNDVKGWISRNWDSLKASHAAAAAKGPAAEAEWWGRVTGRAAFEVASLVVPATKFATAAKAGEALNVALKAGKLGDLFAEASKAGKLGEVFSAANRTGKIADLVTEARNASRLPELAQAAGSTRGGVQALIRDGKLTLQDVATLEKSGALKAGEVQQARQAIASASLKEMMGRAPAAKAEIDGLAQRIAAEHGGRVATAPIKSEGRALQKILTDYAGEAGSIKDLARNTIIVDRKDIPAVVSQLQAAGAKVKTIGAATDPLGYSGVNATIVTKSGLTAEIQVNTAKMIFAKETPANARAILGSPTYDAIAREVGLPGGRGHELYEQWRALPPDAPQAKAIAAESRAYYSHFQ